MSTYHLIMRWRTLDEAIASAQRLTAKFGRQAFMVIEDANPQWGGGTWTRYAVVSYANPYDFA